MHNDAIPSGKIEIRRGHRKQTFWKLTAVILNIVDEEALPKLQQTRSCVINNKPNHHLIRFHFQKSLLE
jgi:hypothetical protein